MLLIHYSLCGYKSYIDCYFVNSLEDAIELISNKTIYVDRYVLMYDRDKWQYICEIAFDSNIGIFIPDWMNNENGDFYYLDKNCELIQDNKLLIGKIEQLMESAIDFLKIKI